VEEALYGEIKAGDGCAEGVDAECGKGFGEGGEEVRFMMR